MAGTREAIDGAAAAAGLGRPSGTFGSLRYVSPKVAWAAVGGAAVWGLLMTVNGAYVIAPLVVPIVLIILAVVRYRVSPVGGRRWLMLYEHGIVELARTPDADQGRLRLVRWSEVAGVAPDPVRPGAYALTVVAPAGEPASPVRLADLSPAAKLRSRLTRHLPHVSWPTDWPPRHGRVALTTLGFAALAILPALVPIVRMAAPRLAADTATGTVVGPTPSTAGSPIGSPAVAAPSATPSTSSPAVPVLPMPSTTDGFYEACRVSATFPDARPYSGPPPHLVYFPVPWFGDRSWQAAEPSAVQLVVCTDRRTNSGAKVRNCTYQTSDGPFTQQLIKTTWTVTIFEARTGRVVAQKSVVGGTTSCLPGLLPDYDTFPPSLSKIQETRLTDRQAYDTVGKYVLR
jgi:hypothetical protein